MQLWQIIILAFSGLSVFNSLALLIYLQVTGRSKETNIFLQIILLAFVFQVSYALLEIFGQNSLSFAGNLYLIGIYCQGPSMYLYITKSLKPDYKIWPKQLLIHYLPWLILGILPYDFINRGAKEWIAIYLVGIQSLFYILISIKPFLDVRDLFRRGEKRYFLAYYIFPAFAMLWIIYPVSGSTQINYQFLEIVLHSLFLYYFIVLKIREPAGDENKYRFTGLDTERSRSIFEQADKIIMEKELFLNPNLSLAMLSKKVAVPLNLLSQAINQNSKYNFRDYINTFRIEKSKTEIADKCDKGFTIASIAYDCGFNSLSAFNRAFKKHTGITPSEYIKTSLTKL